MDRKFEQAINGESLGIPKDIFSDPGKYEDEIPLWKRTVGFIRQFERSKSKGKDILFEQLANFAIKDLSTLSPLFDNFSLAGQARPDLDLDEITDDFVKHLEQSAARRSILPSWTPERIEQLMTLGLEREEKVGKVAEKIKSAVFNTPETVTESLDLHYKAAWAMISTVNPEVRKELFSGLCLEKDWFKVTSFCAIAFHHGSLLSGAELSKYLAVRKALDYVGQLDNVLNGLSYDQENSRVKARYQHVAEIGNQIEQLSPDVREKVIKLIREEFRKYPDEIQRQIDFFASGKTGYVQPMLFTKFDGNEDINEALDAAQGRGRELEESRLAKRLAGEDQPYEDLFNKISIHLSPLTMKAFSENEFLRLKSHGFEKLNRIPIQLPNDALLIIAARGYQTIEQKNAVIKEIYESILQRKSANPLRKVSVDLDRILDSARLAQGAIIPFDDARTIVIALQRSIPTEEYGRLSSILEYHRPSISSEQYLAINEKLKDLKKDLRIKFTKSVGKRGYTVVISDPFLREMGYQTLTFRQEDRGGKLSTGLQLAGQQYEFSLDPNYGLVLDKDFKRVISPQDQAWLELLTLSHLKRVICTDEDSIQDELVGGQKQFELYRKQMVHRSEHLRRLPSGYNFSTEAFSRCLKSRLPIRSLLEINRLRVGINWGGTIETGIWTYVSGVEKDIDTQTAKPVKVAFKGASDDMRKIIPLGEISTEEANRIEQEILRELEVV